MKNSHENHLFNILFSAMGSILLAIAFWIGGSVAHLPAIEQKLNDYIEKTSGDILAINKRIDELAD